MKSKIYLNCGYEDSCKNKDCLKCNKQIKYNFKNLKLSIAEAIVIEDFAMTDIGWHVNERPKELELMQKIMQKIMHKIFECEIEDKRGNPLVIKY